MKLFRIDGKAEGKKLFRFIKTVLPGLKNTEIFMLLRKKLIRVNGKKAGQDHVLREGDRVEVRISSEGIAAKEKKSKFHSVKKDFDVVYEDSDVLVVNKYRGMLVHPDKDDYKNSLHEMVRSYLYSKKEYDPSDAFTPAPCHRLDKNTSGLMVFAKNQRSLSRITKELRDRKAVKTYIALVSGRVDREFLITSGIDVSGPRVIVDRLEQVYAVPDKDGFLEKNPGLSATLIKPLRHSGKYSIVEAELWTGKKHQIRAHLCACGYPLLGDRKYFTKASEAASREILLGHYFLHSSKLKIEGYGEWKARMPGDMEKAIGRLFDRE